MKTYPSEQEDWDYLKKLNAQQWMVELLKANPSYVHWAPWDDYMHKKADNQWESPISIPNWKEFSIKLNDYNEVVHFYFEIVRDGHDCPGCNGMGMNKGTMELHENFYGNLDPSQRWCESLTQDEMQVLKEHSRIPPDTTLDQINTCKNWGGIKHDCLNHWLLTETRAKRLGVYGKCPDCSGEEVIYDEDEAHVRLVLWLLHPRKGAARGIRIERLEREDLPVAIEYLYHAKQRSVERFSGLDKLTRSNHDLIESHTAYKKWCAEH